MAQEPSHGVSRTTQVLAASSPAKASEDVCERVGRGAGRGGDLAALLKLEWMAGEIEGRSNPVGALSREGKSHGRVNDESRPQRPAGA